LLAENGATLDSIHLSQAGHEQMAFVVWQLLAPALSGAAGDRTPTASPESEAGVDFHVAPEER
jgi:hypothetical protein